MKKIAFCSLAALLAASPALAADLRKADPDLIAPAGVTINWTGVSVGAHGGYGNGNNDVSASGKGWSASLDGIGGDGYFAGGTVGIDVARGHYLFGVFGDYDVSNVETTAGVAIGTNTATGSIKENNSWKVGGRGGYLVGQEKRVLLFAEGGWQQDETTYSYAVNGKCPSKTCSADLTFSGVFVGGGAEYALNGWSSIGVRYDHFFGSTETLMTGVDVTRDTDQVLFEAKLKLTGSAFGFGSGF